MRNYFKKYISYPNRLRLKFIYQDCISLFTCNLVRIGKIYKTDKYYDHNYLPIYSFHFSKLKYKKINLLEIGIGGYENPLYGGHSLRMWRKYFVRGNIFGLDLYDKKFHEERRIKIYTGDQTDSVLLNKINTDANGFDIIIDDGSHVNEHVIKTFNILFPLLKKGGIYVIEDTQTAYWEEYGGSSSDLESINSSVNYFKQFINGLNYEEFIINNYKPGYFDLNITEIHFYHNIIIIYKGDNNKGSNLVIDNKFKHD